MTVPDEEFAAVLAGFLEGVGEQLDGRARYLARHEDPAASLPDEGPEVAAAVTAWLAGVEDGDGPLHRRAGGRRLDLAPVHVRTVGTVGALVLLREDGPRPDDVAGALAFAAHLLGSGIVRGRAEGQRWVRELAQALHEDQLELHYQPEFALADGRIVGVEALLRWRHPRLGLITADRFIAATEAGPGFAAVGRWTVDRACAQAAAWRGDGGGVLTVWVNLSAAQLVDDATVDHLLAALDRHGLPPGAVGVELTERSVPTELGPLGSALDRLRAAGVLLAVDDFGTGQNTLRTTLQVPFDIIKIDRSFVEQMRADTRMATTVEAIAGWAGRLGAELVAEGVDSPATAARLLALGCTRGQGNGLAPAGPADVVGAMLRGPGAGSSE